MRDLSNVNIKGPQSWAIALAVAAPTLLAFNLAPSPTLLNQCVSIGLWGVAVAVFGLAPATQAARHVWVDTRLLQAALIATLLMVVLGAVHVLPFGIACGAVATLWAAIVVVEAGGESAQRGGIRLFVVFASALLAAGLRAQPSEASKSSRRARRTAMSSRERACRAAPLATCDSPTI